MKYAITGHTSGIGKTLFDRLNPNIVGFSKSTGYDITTIDGRKRILNEAWDCDVFINNACDRFGQSELLLDIFYSWKHKSKIIVNVGSRIADDGLILPVDRENLLHYQSYKRSLKMISDELVKRTTNLSIKYVSFGYVGTDKILKKYPNLTDYISENKAADLILGAIYD